MTELYPEALITVIASSSLEGLLTRVVRNHSVSGYTVVRARGAGATGAHEGLLDFDGNIQLTVIVPTGKRDGILNDLKGLMRKGHRFAAYVSEVQVLNPKQFDQPLPGQR